MAEEQQAFTGRDVFNSMSGLFNLLGAPAGEMELASSPAEDVANVRQLLADSGREEFAEDGKLSQAELFTALGEKAAADVDRGTTPRPSQDTIQAGTDFLRDLGIDDPNGRIALGLGAVMEDFVRKINPAEAPSYTPGGQQPRRQATPSSAEDQLRPTGEDFLPLFVALNGQNESDVNRDFVQDFTVLNSQTAEGGILVRSQETGHNIHIYDGGVTGDISAEERLTDEGLEAQIELALMAKSMPDAENGMAYYHPDMTAKMIGDEAAELVGLHILNEAPQDLSDANPELAQRMQQVWERMKQERPELAQVAATQEQNMPVPSLQGNTIQDVYNAFLATDARTEQINQSLVKTGISPDRIDPDLEPAVWLENISRHGLSFVGEGTHERTGTALISEINLDQRFIDSAERLFAQHGIQDPDGTLAQGFAALNQTIFNNPELSPIPSTEQLAAELYSAAPTVRMSGPQ